MVTLTLRPDAHTSPTIATTKTAAKGDYSFSNVAAGKYSLAFTLDGFKNVLRSGVLMTAGFVNRVDQQLEPGTVRVDRANWFAGDTTTKLSTAQAQSGLSCGLAR